MRCQVKQGKAGSGEYRHLLCRSRGSHLGFSHPEEGLLFPKVHLDLPSPQISLQHLFQRQRGVRAEEVSWFLVDEVCALAWTVGERPDDDEHHILGSRRLPPCRGDGLDVEGVHSSPSEGIHLAPWD